jgi:hypothetical protein
MNKYWDNYWNRNGWYYTFFNGGHLNRILGKELSNTVIRILWNDKPHKYATYLLDINAVDNFFEGYGKGIDKFRAPRLDPTSDTHVWYDPPNSDLSNPKKK